MRAILVGLATFLPLAWLGGCGSSNPTPADGPSVYTKDSSNGAARKLGKGNKTPSIRLSNEGTPPK